MFLLDTNVISETRRLANGKINIGVKQWLDSLTNEPLFTNTVVLMELERGILGMERKDAMQGKLLRQWFEQDILSFFEGRILSLDTDTAKICARLHIPENDAWIASSAIQHNLTLVTRNIADFERTGVKLLNPFN